MEEILMKYPWNIDWNTKKKNDEIFKNIIMMSFDFWGISRYFKHW